MSLNGPVIRMLTSELKSKLIGARIDKVYQENKDISMHLRADRENYILYFSFSADNPAVYLTNKKSTYPQEPPMFCMLLRKYLVGAKILNIEQIRLDRIISFTFSSSADIYKTDQLSLQFEIMGKYSNLILVDKNNNEIIDSLIRVYPDMSSVRLVLPKEEYLLPEPNGLCPLSSTKEDINDTLLKNEFQKLKTSIFKSFEGLNPDIASFILNTIKIDPERNYNNLNNDEKNNLCELIFNTFSDIKNYNLKALVYEKNGVPSKISAFDLSPLYNYHRSFTTMNEAIKFFYETKSSYKIISSRSNELRKKLQKRISTLEKTLNIQKLEYEKSKNREGLKMQADLLAANIYRIQRGSKSIDVNNFYSERNELIKIDLDESLSPKQNVERLYNRYNKMKNREINLEKRIPKLSNEIYYLKSVIINLEQSETNDEIENIKSELRLIGFLRSTNSKKKIREPKITYREYISPSGYKILAGRNNLQNDKLTFKTAHKEDLWFHVRNEPGSHVVLFSHNQKISEDDILSAANIAAILSGKTAKCSIDYTEIKNVKKIKNKNPGLVNYYKYSTVTIDPDPNKIKES